MGRDYWAPFLAMIRTMVEAGTIAAADLDLMLVTDSTPDAMAHLEKYAVEHFGLIRRKLKASTLLGERPLT
jgi:predicted Rossmann-fold nucleotide-binding protein